MTKIKTKGEIMQRFFIKAANFMLLFFMLAPNFANAGGAQMLVRLLVNKSTAVANGTDEITLSIYTFQYECNGTYVNGLGETHHPIVALYDLSTVSSLCASSTDQHDPSYHEIAATYPPYPSMNVSVEGASATPSTFSEGSGNGYHYSKIKSTIVGSKTIIASGPGDWSGHDRITVNFVAPSGSSAISQGNTSGQTQTQSQPPTTSSGTPTTPALDQLSLNVGNQTFKGNELSTQNQFTAGGSMIFSGKTIPNGIVTLYFQSDPFEDKATADKDGNWAYTLTKDLGEGEHALQIAVTDPATNKTSEKSAPAKFTLVAAIKSENQTQASKTQDYTWWYVGGVIVALILTGTLGFSIYKRKKNSSKGKKENKAENPEETKTNILKDKPVPTKK